MWVDTEVSLVHRHTHFLSLFAFYFVRNSRQERPAIMPTSTPHLVPIPFPLTEGKEILIEGQILPDAKRFTVSLCEGSDHKQNTPVTFDTRLNDNVIVRNHHHDNKWGSEDRQGGVPYKKGDNVEIKIVVKNDLFQFIINKQHYCDFKHRIGKETARNVLIEGDFLIHKVSFPGSEPAHQTHAGSQYPTGHTLQDPPVPLNIPIAPLHSGRKLVVAGVPNGKDRFSVNLVCGSGPNDDIALHVDVRFNYGQSQNKVVLNHRVGGNWGGEDVEHSGFPFKPNEPFELLIKVKDDAFKIIVNDEKFDNFPFRVDIGRITHLNVVGEVKLNVVKV